MPVSDGWAAIVREAQRLYAIDQTYQMTTSPEETKMPTKPVAKTLYDKEVKKKAKELLQVLQGQGDVLSDVRDTLSDFVNRHCSGEKDAPVQIKLGTIEECERGQASHYLGIHGNSNPGSQMRLSLYDRTHQPAYYFLTLKLENGKMGLMREMSLPKESNLALDEHGRIELVEVEMESIIQTTGGRY